VTSQKKTTLTIGELNLFSGSDRDRVNEKVVDYLKKLHEATAKGTLTDRADA
jgi:hypothetical protein